MTAMNWYWLDGDCYCPACVECDTPPIDSADATRGPNLTCRCHCCGEMPFVPTHKITTNAEAVDVMLVDGAAYTAAEWESSGTADYECDSDGKWTFQGRPFAGCVEQIS